VLFNLILWGFVLLGAVWAAHWGADQLAEPLKKLRSQWGLTEAAGASFVALATASPEVGINASSAISGLKDIGLGNLLGSNIVSVPALVTVAYIASRVHSAKRDRATGGDNRPQPPPALQVKPEALTVQALPYLAIVGLAALLTVPAPWRGLQPIDGWIMLAAYLVYVAQAILRYRREGEAVRWGKRELIVAVLGVVVLAVGAYSTVIATENIVGALGLSQLIGGLFITSTMSILPEIFATWSVSKSGQVTAATTGVIADNAVTMTLAFFPLALVTLPVQDFLLFSVNLAFVAILGIVYAAEIYWGAQKNSFELWEVLVLDGIYVAYLAVIIWIYLG
jgi:cation:H+ antiporter